MALSICSTRISFLGLLKSSPEVMALVSERSVLASECAYISITRMELLGFADLSEPEQQLIESRLSALTYLPVTPAVEDQAIRLRKQRKVKLPDAIIGATAQTHALELLTLDAALQSVMSG